ncbi:hypothetical protein D3C77_778560 [compost metagenome]
MVRSDHNRVLMAMAERISAPPMVGVPFLDRCDCGPSVRTDWPICRVCRVRIIQGPSHKARIRDVSTPRMPRRVRY